MFKSPQHWLKFDSKTKHETFPHGVSGNGNRSTARVWGLELKNLSLLIGVLIAAFGVSARAQDIQEFNGHVVDTTGAVIPHAEVVIQNQETGVKAKTETNGSGYYISPYLQPDVYTITVSQNGFQTQQKTDVQLQVDQSITLNFTLKVGAQTQTVRVSANAVHVNLTNPDRGEVIGEKRIANLPLDGRNPFGLFSLSPGTHDFSNNTQQAPADDVTNFQYVNGTQPEINIGGQTNDAGGDSQAGYATTAAYVPALDALKEYKIVLNAYDASYGPPSAIDLSMKSGGNHFHGIADLFIRRQWLDATPWQATYLQPKDPHKPAHLRNQWSLTFTGPVTIPHVYNGHNKLFFLINYAQLNDVTPDRTIYTFSLPNPQWLTGNFNGATYWSSKTNSLQPLIIYDPLTPLHPVVDPHDGKTKMAHYPFPGNVIPPSMIDPVGKAMLQYITDVYKNQPSKIVNPGPGYAPYTNNYENQQVVPAIWRNAIIKIDYNPNEANRFSFQWTGQGHWQTENNETGLLNSNPGNMNSHSAQRVGQTGKVQWTHTFGPNLLMDLGAVLITNKSKNTYGNRFSNNELKALGFAAPYYNQLENLHNFPYVTLSGLPGAKPYVNLGFVITGNAWFLHDLGIRPKITYVHGKHVIRAGMDIRFEQWSNPLNGRSDHYNFTNNFTDEFGPGYSDDPGYYSGSAVASLLLGYMDSGTVYHNLHSFYSQHYFAPWVEDNWHITRKLTLDLGFRWDFLTPRVERHNKLDGSFNPSVLNPVSGEIPTGTVALGSGTQLLGGMNFAGVNGQPRGAFAMNKFDWQPRVGFAYAITNSMSFRGGVGRFYENNTAHNGQDGFSSYTNYTNSLDGGVTPYTATTGLGLSDPYSTVQQPTGASKGYLQDLGESFSFYNPHYVIPSLWSYSMTYEVGLTRNDVLSVSYAGNISPDQPVSFNVNHISASWDAMCDVERGGNHHICDDPATGQIANPFKGVAAFQGTGYYSENTISKANCTRPYPEFGNITEEGYNNGGSNWYNSLQLTYEHHFTSGIEFHFTYTHEKDMTAGDYLTANDSTADLVKLREEVPTNSINHTITFSGVMELPFGRGKMLFAHVNRGVDEIINGWQVSPLLVYNTGFPWRAPGNWEWLNGATSMGVGHENLRPDATHDYYRIRGATPCVGYKDTDTGEIVPGGAAVAAGCKSLNFVTAPNGYALPRNTVDFGIRQPGNLRFDAALSKSINLHEAVGVIFPQNTHLVFRVDALNVLNHPSWDDGYISNLNNINFGTIEKGPESPSTLPRYLQLSAKVSW